MAKSMDVFDWTAGLSFRQVVALATLFPAPTRCSSHGPQIPPSLWQVRVKEAPPETCGSYQSVSMDLWFLSTSGVATVSELLRTPRSFGPCYPNYVLDEGVKAEEDTDNFGFNWTHPTEPLSRPWKHYTSKEIGSDPSGQPSASTQMKYNIVPTSGFVSFIIPFFTSEFLPAEEGRFSEVTDYRRQMYEISSGRAAANFFCVRLSWDGEHVRQLCDPNNEGGETTGVVQDAVRAFWGDMKSAHWIDAQSRVVTLTLPVRSNNLGMRARLSMIMQISGNGGVVPSYDTDTRVDNAEVKIDVALNLLWTTLALVVYFIIIEAFEVRQEGPFSYFTNMWNAMDWAGFLLFFATFNSYLELADEISVANCHDEAFICTGVGFDDGWSVMKATKQCKLYLSVASTLQMLKVIKFVNVFVPKMALATSVLSHGLGDLAFFTVFFFFTIFAFGQLFFIQLGPIDESYLAQFDASFSLFRALFGDFDIQLIMDSSPSYINGMLFVAYLFSAIFILLSIFLTILGEHQAFVRDEQDEAKAAGLGVDEYGVLSVGIKWVKKNIFQQQEQTAGPPASTPAGAGPAADGQHHATHQGSTSDMLKEFDSHNHAGHFSDMRIVLRSNEELSCQLEELKAMFSTVGVGSMCSGSSSSAEAEKAAEAQRKLEAQTSAIARMRAVQATRTVESLEKYLLVIRSKQDEQSELLKRLLEERERGSRTPRKHDGGDGERQRQRHKSSRSSKSDFSSMNGSSHHGSQLSGSERRRSRSPVQTPNSDGASASKLVIEEPTPFSNARRSRSSQSQSSRSESQSQASGNHGQRSPGRERAGSPGRGDRGRISPNISPTL